METKKEERIDQIKSSTAGRNRAQKNEQPNSERELIRMEKVKIFRSLRSRLKRRINLINGKKAKTFKDEKRERKDKRKIRREN